MSNKNAAEFFSIQEFAMYPFIKPYVFAMLIVVVTGTLTAETQYEAVTVAKEHFAQRQFSEGRGVLLGRLKTPKVSLDEKSSIFSALGDFYCHDVGDYTQGMHHYEKAVSFNSDDPTALSQIESIRSQHNKHRQIDQWLTGMLATLNRSRPDDLSGLKEKARSLEMFAANTPDYYRSAELFYCLGTYHAARGQELKAIEYYNRAFQVKPGIDFMLPVSGKIKALHSRWLTETITAGSTGVFAVMFLVSALLFYTTRPWRWLTPRHVAGLALLNILLCIVTLAIQKGLAATYAVSGAAEEFLSQGGIYLYTSINSPGFSILAVFMIHLVIGLSLIFVFALSLSNLVKNKIVAASVSGIAGTVIMASLICIYYMRNCDMKLDNTPDLSINGLFDTSNAMIFSVEGIEPYILTDPEAFPNPSVIHNVDPPLENWAKEHCPFDEPHASEGQ
jgi:tetratricopeptide (TPR) repeat protein